MTTSTDRRRAMQRANHAEDLLATAGAEGHAGRILVSIVRSDFYTDAEAWDAVSSLEELVQQRGLISEAEIEAARRAYRAEISAELDDYLAKIFPERAPK